ncbi:hypothetical protein LTR37_012043 [Vermiconidia calcicola]|uniref:Uncharacterized protein n=1 Tax=Vermiconidia calcicola TaxID=1690605 RepID=A0ACC3N1H4_9PEZI|nr:hypothetical protein LTR37_012043 [Vermiconidia calcicola]
MSEPITRTASAAGSVVSIPTPLRHPTPDLNSLQGAFVKNIAKLERTAEEMSASGSDLDEEIRRRSRGNSVQSSNNGDISVVRPSMTERLGSTRSTRSGSYGRNIVDVNGAARWGGYSPGGYVTSPVGSASGSWSHSASLSRVTSASKSSRLAQVSEPMQEGRPLDSPLRPSFSVHEDDEEEEEEMAHLVQARSREPSQSSFALRYDEIAGEIEQSLQDIPPSPPKNPAQLHHDHALERLEVGGTETPPDRPRSTDTFREAQVAFQDFDGVHFSPDTDELVELDEYGNEIRRVSARSTSGALSIEAASLLRTPRARPISYAAPPPDEDMVYYPAPVPRMLNLPKRLSQLPAASVQAKRRSQVLSQLPQHAKAGAPWLAQEEGARSSEESAWRGQHRRGSGSSGVLPRGFLNERMSTNMSNLPPQLRANMYFEHQPIQQDVEIKSESAVATFDSILEASATAPAHAFTDHPFAGDVRKSVYSMERTKRQSTATIATHSTPEKKPKKRRSSSIGALLKRTRSSDELTNTLRKRGSRASVLTDLDFNEGGNKLRKRKSLLSLGDELDREEDAVRTPADEIEEPNLRSSRSSGLIAGAQNSSPMEDDDRRVSRAPTVMSSGYRLDNAEAIEDDPKEEAAQEDDAEGEPLFVQPSTLLAELQVRKAQQKSRSRTAATAFPNGMHSTLLELDAVEEINKRKRKNQRIALAWEDPHQRALDEDVDKGDEDVPLGMLFSAKDGVKGRKTTARRDWDRPVGLMEKREMEDNEPLSNRRNRLRGGSPTRGRAPNNASRSQLNLAEPQDGAAANVEGENREEAEEEGETLGERLRRLRTKEALDGAIADVAPKEGERPKSTFTDDVISQFGGLDVKNKDRATPDPSTKAGASPQPPDEEETLGQRRARLQREREASGAHSRNVSDGSNRPPMLRSASSLANLLSANPIGQRPSAKTYESAQGTLLHANQQLQAKHKNQLQSTNMRSSSYGMGMPLVDSRVQQHGGPVNAGGLLSGHQSRAPAGGFAAGTYNNGMGGIQMQQTATPMSYGGNPGISNGGYFASPTAGMGGYGNPHQGMMGYQQQPQMRPQQQQMPSMMIFPHQQQQYPSMMNPNAYNALNGYGGAGNSYIPQTMGGGTYASFAQNNNMMTGNVGGVNMGMAYAGAGGMAMPLPPGMGGLTEADLNPNQRAAIDRWRMSVAQQ